MVWILRYKLIEADRRILMNNIDGTRPTAAKTQRRIVALFLLISTFGAPSTLSAQSQIVWQSFSSGFAISKGDKVSLVSVIGQPFIGDASGNGISLRSGFGSPISTMTSVRESRDKIPLTYTLSQNFPNPFNPSTVIAFGIPEASHVSVHIFDLVGREVATLVNEDLIAGNYRSTFVADHLSSGVYFYRIVAASNGGNGRMFVETKKFLLIR